MVSITLAIFKNNLTIFKNKHSTLKISRNNIFKWFHKDFSIKFKFVTQLYHECRDITITESA